MLIIKELKGANIIENKKSQRKEEEDCDEIQSGSTMVLDFVVDMINLCPKCHPVTGAMIIVMFILFKIYCGDQIGNFFNGMFNNIPDATNITAANVVVAANATTSATTTNATINATTLARLFRRNTLIENISQ